jgi:peptidoglycan/xylan/chitin deacetylase (PgdA/CDA1 family)
MMPGLIITSREICRLPLRQCLLTFDDGPSGAVTDQILLVLREFGVKACFCVVGSRIVARPEQTRAIAAAGHLLVNHTFNHRFGDLWDLERLESDLALCDQAVADATGTPGGWLLWFRPPFGILTRPVLEVARKRRILPITQYALDTWFNSARTTLPGRLIIQNAKRQGGGIYVLHDGLVCRPASGLLNRAPDRSWVPNVVRRILENLSAEGFQFPDPREALPELALPGAQC